jgi:hypothetical protein
LLQRRYVTEVNARFDRNVTIRTVASNLTEPVASDLLISFFAISELNKDTVDRYARQYISHATSGFLQLNFDDEGTSTMIGNKRTSSLYSALEMFKLVYRLHPNAVLLPPPDYHDHHRIMWKPSLELRRDPSQRAGSGRGGGFTAADADDNAGGGGECNCRAFTGEYLTRMGKELLDFH